MKEKKATKKKPTSKDRDVFGLGLRHNTGQIHVDKRQRIKEGGMGGHSDNGGFLGADAHPPHGNPVKAAKKEHPSAQENYKWPQHTRQKWKRLLMMYTPLLIKTDVD